MSFTERLFPPGLSFYLNILTQPVMPAITFVFSTGYYCRIWFLSDSYPTYQWVLPSTPV